jgi:hypothetical protein
MYYIFLRHDYVSLRFLGLTTIFERNKFHIFAPTQVYTKHIAGAVFCPGGKNEQATLLLLTGDMV